jgi:transposase
MPREAFPGRGRLPAQAQRIRDLEQKLRDVTQERDILKKALAYFVNDPK